MNFRYELDAMLKEHCAVMDSLLIDPALKSSFYKYRVLLSRITLNLNSRLELKAASLIEEGCKESDIVSYYQNLIFKFLEKYDTMDFSIDSSASKKVSIETNCSYCEN